MLLPSCSYVYADKFTVRVQNVRLPNACMHRNVSCVHTSDVQRQLLFFLYIQYNSGYLTCSKNLTGSQLSLPHGINRKWKCEPGVKINGVYYHDVLLIQNSLLVIRQISGNEFVFQQDSAPAHRGRARETILSSYTSRDAPDFISPEQWPPNTPDLNPRWTTKSGLQCSNTSTRQRFEMLTNCDSVCWMFGTALNKMHVIDASIDQWRVRLKACVRSGGRHFEHMP